MQKIKVLHILHSFGIGGMEKGIVTLVQHASADFEHVILCLSISGASQDMLPIGTRVLELHKQEGSSYRFLLHLAKVIRQEKPDIVHTRNWGGMDGVIAARLAGCKRIVHGEHGWGMDDPDGSSKKRALVRRVLSLGVMEFTAVSLQIKDWLENSVRVFRPVTQIYNGIDVDVYNQGGAGSFLRSELGLSAKSLLRGVVGRLDPIKDHVGLFQAFSQVREKISDAHLIVIGDGPEMSRLKYISTQGIHFLGMRTDIPEIYRSLDVFALASFNEGISNTILEAMACGLPVVSTAVGGTPELITHDKNGFLVQPGGYKQFANFLLRYLMDIDLRKQHGEISQRIIQERFSVSAMIVGYESVWRRGVAN